MAASSINPAIGASTCAFGNHRWRPYRGTFTINAIIHASHWQMLDQGFGRGWTQYWTIRKFREPKLFWVYSNATMGGAEILLECRTGNRLSDFLIEW